MARTSSFAFKDTDKTIAEIADILGVQAVLEGSVRRSVTVCGLPPSWLMPEAVITSGPGPTSASLPIFSNCRMNWPEPSCRHCG